MIIDAAIKVSQVILKTKMDTSLPTLALLFCVLRRFLSWGVEYILLCFFRFSYLHTVIVITTMLETCYQIVKYIRFLEGIFYTKCKCSELCRVERMSTVVYSGILVEYSHVC